MNIKIDKNIYINRFKYIMTSNTNSFKYCECMENSCNSWTNAMMTEHTAEMSDAQTNKLCCAELECFCWPIYIIYDILSCPFRGCIYIYKYKCSRK